MSTIPYDENIEKCGSEDCSVIDVPEDSKAYMAVKELGREGIGEDRVRVKRLRLSASIILS
jgi:hypothetical protein